MRSPLEIFKVVIIYVLVFLLCILAVFLIVGLAQDIMQSLSNPGLLEDIRQATLKYVGEILLVVIIIELIDTIMVYWKEHAVKVGSVLLVALTAVARELIVFDYYYGKVEILAGTSLAVLTLALAIYLMSKSVAQSSVGKKSETSADK
ncbi:MAG: phosphate-starvation-inducible PsiE family protein [Methanomassiliicoccales archaeon]